MTELAVATTPSLSNPRPEPAGSSPRPTFFRALMRGDLLGEAEMTEMLRTVSTETDPLAGKASGDLRAGLGIFGFTLACGSPWGHGGDMPGYSNQVLASRDGSTIVVVAQNTSGWPLANEVAEGMFCL